jgi:hypothetical protein
MSHSEQVRWPLVYAWNGNRFEEDRGRFSFAVQDALDDAESRLKEHQDDPVLLKYLGKEYCYEGNWRRGLNLLHHMERECRDIAAHDKEDVDSLWNLADIAEFTGKRPRARSCFLQTAAVCRQLAHHATEAFARDYYTRMMKDARLRAERVR